MKKNKIVTILTIVSVVLSTACKKTNEPSPTNPPGSSTVALQTTVQPTVALAGASTLAILAGSAISNTGATNVTGDIGLSPGSSIGGFPPGILVGTQHINDATATQAKLDLTAAYNDAAGRTCTDIVTLSGNIGGLTLTPGLYKSTSSLAISSGDLTFDAKGNPNAVFIIQIASTLTTTSGRKVILSGGASASNIFWQVGSSATFGTTSVFKGTLLVMQSITFNTGATLDGRGLARTGAVIMAGNTIVRQ
ncbi:MAG: ice-binding family protein [Bacteroidota bacterium]